MPYSKFEQFEQTYNRDSKVQGGLKGITGNRGAVHRWIMSQHERAAITRQCEVMAGVTGQTRERKDLDKSRTIRDEEAVENIISTCESMVNPFDTLQTELVSLSSGATSEVKEDLLSAERMGEKTLMAYMEEKLISPTGDMFRPIKRLNLKTFSEQSKRQGRSQADKTIVSNDKKLFSRLLVIGQSRKMDLREILSFSLAPVSQPLANDEGSFTKSNKAALLHILETKPENSLVDCVPSRGALIIDGMALLHGLHGIPSTFGKLADYMLMQILKLAQRYDCSRVYVVVDQYPEISIKNFEHFRRAASRPEIIHIHSKQQKTPSHWKRYISDGKNKEAIAEFLFITWKEASFKTIQREITLYITHGGECHCLHVNSGLINVRPVEDLFCDP